MDMNVILAICLALRLAGPAQGTEPQVHVSSGIVLQGELIWIAVSRHDEKQPPHGFFRGNPLTFFNVSSGTYVALAATDVEASTGTYPLTLGLTSQSGELSLQKSEILLRPREEKIQKIQVDKEYTAPSSGNETRVEIEQMRLNEIFDHPTREKIFTGSFMMPVPGPVLSDFGRRRLYNQSSRSLHAGVDLRAPENTPVLASGTGRVALADELFLPGKTVVLDHGAGLFSYYAHLSSFCVKPGDMIAKGETLGYAGKTGRATGSHLHWAARLRRERIDPLSLMALDWDAWISTVAATSILSETTAASTGAAPAPIPPQQAPTTRSAPKREHLGREAPPVPIQFPAGYKPFRGLHLTSWAAGSVKARRKVLEQMKQTPLNGIVVAVKEMDGLVYIPGVAKAVEFGTQHIAIPDPEGMLDEMKRQGLYTVARVVVFKDDMLPRKKPEWAVHRPNGKLWVNKNGVAWTDPYQRPIWEYNLDVASRAAALGFDEIQFDYIRFPSDGDISQCRFSRVDHSSQTAIENLAEFMRYAKERLKPLNVKVSVAIFGLTTTARNDLGIGQKLIDLAGFADYISPMMYPSHYAKGSYGLPDPNREPYKVIDMGLSDAKARLASSSYKLRPYLQDFSLGFRYGPDQVLAEIAAAHKQHVDSWILWNPGNHYTWELLRDLTHQSLPQGDLLLER